MALSAVSEPLIISPTGTWATDARRRFRLSGAGSERLNTPFRRTLVYLLARTRGGLNRCRILKLLQQEGPLNANQIAGILRLHYTTVQHHLTRLVRDDVIVANPRDDSYGALFFLTYQMERNAELLEEIFPDLDGPSPPRTPDARGIGGIVVAVP